MEYPVFPEDSHGLVPSSSFSSMACIFSWFLVHDRYFNGTSTMGYNLLAVLNGVGASSVWISQTVVSNIGRRMRCSSEEVGQNMHILD